MSVDGTRLLFEGFLQKRKDTLKIRWVTYWFRLQNTTLFFYTQKNGSASHLRGYYYIYRVQSVREIQKNDRKPFVFEMIMTNGKRKFLAAETAALRKQWVAHLWQAMQLSATGVYDPGVMAFDLYDQRDRLNSDSVMEVVAPRPISTFSSSEHIYCEAGGIASSIRLSEEQEQDNEEDLYQNIKRPFTSKNHSEHRGNDPQSSSEVSFSENGQEKLYDFIPSARCDAAEAEMSNAVYNFPQSYKDSTQQHESIYDVPSCSLRRSCDLPQDEQMEEETYWKI